MLALLWLLAPLAAVGGIVAVYMNVVARNRAGWNTEEAVVVERAGAYRSSQKTVGIVERIRDVPSEVQVAAIAALFFGIMWLPSIPFVAIGCLVEADEGPGLATLFGVPGIALSVGHLVLGIRFTKRTASARKLARGIAAWSIVHNVALLALTVAVNVQGHVSKALDIVHFDKVGVVVVLYASASLAYALYAIRAATVHEALDSLGRVEEPFALDDTAKRIEPAVIMPAPPAAAPVAVHGPSWP